MSVTYWIFDGRANACAGTDDATLLEVCVSLPEARKNALDHGYGNHIWKATGDDEGNVDLEFVETVWGGAR